MYFTNTPALNSMEAIMKKLPYYALLVVGGTCHDDRRR